MCKQFISLYSVCVRETVLFVHVYRPSNRYFANCRVKIKSLYRKQKWQNRQRAKPRLVHIRIFMRYIRRKTKPISGEAARVAHLPKNEMEHFRFYLQYFFLR